MSKKNFIIKIADKNDSSKVEYSHTNQPKQRKARLKQNIQASKGDAGQEYYFPRWDTFKDVPYEDITFEVFRSMDGAEAAF